MKTLLFIAFSTLLSFVSCNTNTPYTIAQEKVKRDSLLLDSLSKLPSTKFSNALQFESKEVKKAIEIYVQIRKTDSTTYWAKQADIRLRFLEGQAAKKEFIKKISDTWRWEWKGTNWGKFETPEKGKLERHLVIKENYEIEFYENGKLIRSDTFDLKSNNEYTRDKYLLELKSSKEIYSLWYNGIRLTLSEPDCVCGCLTNEYFRKWKRDM
ncbi:MAG: hypothetical protein ACKOXB_07910 [Flavobacteriales bacterium]